LYEGHCNLTTDRLHNLRNAEIKNVFAILSIAILSGHLECSPFNSSNV